MIWLVSGLLACSGGSGPVPEGGAPALHRLTEAELHRTLRDLFRTDELPPLTLPRDVPVHGFDNNALTRDATPYLVEALQRDLGALLADVVTRPGPWLSCDPSGGDDPKACGHATLTQTMSRAWRRPTTESEQRWITDLFDGWLALGFGEALQLSLQTLLLSPDFLYQIEHGTPGDPTRLTDFEIANRLSYFLWGTMPDDVLFELAAKGRLQRRSEVTTQARRMIAHPASRSALLDFHKQWLGFEHIQTIDPEPDVFFASLYDGEAADDEEEVGYFVDSLKAALEAEFEEMVRRTVFTTGTLDSLLTTRETVVSEQTAALYGVSFADGEPVALGPYGVGEEREILDMSRVTLPAEQRAGFLTTGAFLASHSHPRQPSPVLRAVFLRDRLLCVPSPPPPDDVPALQAGEEVTWTTNRERYALHTQEPACAGCHIPIDGTGFAFEHYDAVGGWRDTDNGAPVDSSGELVGTDVDGPVPDAVSLIEAIAGSRQLHDCAVLNWYRYATHRSEVDADRQALVALQDAFWASGGVVPELLVDFVSSDAFLTRPLAEAP
ncbi:MAG: DUF1592 domain-containing protein [Myxococcales bacterium]|nr:DUF1592 domain-containing protein [Myxococcales bacterium]